MLAQRGNRLFSQGTPFFFDLIDFVLGHGYVR
jgi:hypothetical protein